MLVLESTMYVHIERSQKFHLPGTMHHAWRDRIVCTYCISTQISMICVVGSILMSENDFFGGGGGGGGRG